jgi:hypothetical protein
MRGRDSGVDALRLLRAQARTQAAVQPHEAHAAERIAEHLARWVAIDDWSDTTAELHAAG